MKVHLQVNLRSADGDRCAFVPVHLMPGATHTFQVLDYTATVACLDVELDEKPPPGDGYPDPVVLVGTADLLAVLGLLTSLMAKTEEVLGLTLYPDVREAGDRLAATVEATVS